ncbi:Rhamnan synthesis F [Candidatus Planktophila vernalis]|uniref:rhamnan synthesis F family protein n=1 Tax=Candidatus Planktophila vernalis TaxID=1884907 RepID=UPI003CF393E6
MKKVVVVHLHYLEVWGELARSISIIDPDELLITTTNLSKAKRLVLIDFPSARIYELENRGRDIYPLIYLSKLGLFDEKAIVWKLHSKRSLHTLRGDKWRKELVDSLARDETRVKTIVSLVENNEASLIGAEKYLTDLSHANFLEHKNLFYSWSEQVNISLKGETYSYIAGTIFACDSRVLAQVKNISLNSDSFKLESNETIFGRWFAIKLFLLNLNSRIRLLNKARSDLDQKTRPASQETYAFEAFFGILAQNFHGTKGLD